MTIVFETQQSLFCVFTNSQLQMEIFTFTLSTILWFIQLCTVLCTVNQAVKASVYFSKIAWSKLFLCNTYTNPIAVVKEVDLGFKLILYKYCFIIVKSILFQIWNIIRQYFLTPPNKNPISSPNPHSLSGWGCVELVQQLQYKTKSVLHFLKVNRFFYHPNKPNTLPPGTGQETLTHPLI